MEGLYNLILAGGVLGGWMALIVFMIIVIKGGYDSTKRKDKKPVE